MPSAVANHATLPEDLVHLRLLVVGGGSAGHVLPALPVIAQLQARGAKVSYVGTYSGLEQALLKNEDVAFYPISAGKLRRYFSWQNFTDLFRILRGVTQAWWLLGRIKPDVVFSKGGFVSFPVALAAWLRRVPVVAHESDITPGLANRLVLPFTKTLCVSFPQTQVGETKAKVVHTGTPLRQEMLHGDPNTGRELLGIGTDKPLLVVTGGSLGADALNTVIRSSLPRLLEHYHVLHVCGQGKLADITAAGYLQKEYVGEGWGDMLAAADLVVSRAGANALFELLTLAKPNLLVPLSAKASRGDQIQNAAYAEQAGYSLVVQEDEFDADALMQGLAQLEQHKLQFQQALVRFEKVDAATAIVDELVVLAGK